MKYLYSVFLIFLSFSNAFATPITIQLNCINKSIPLYIEDGDFTNEQENRFTKEINSISKLKEFINKNFTEGLEIESWNKVLKKIETAVNSKKRSFIRDINSDDLLIDRTQSCTHQSIIQWSNGIYSISSRFDLLSEQDKLYHIYEAITFQLTDRYSNVGHRNYIYKLLIPQTVLDNDKSHITLRSDAGFDYFFKSNGKINTLREITYKNNKVRIAYLVENSQILTPNGNCLASARKPALFEGTIINVLTIKENCLLSIGEQHYVARSETQMTLRNFGVFVNDPLPLFIESIYVTENTVINDNKVQLRASHNPKKKSKVSFKLDASGTPEAYIQFTGKVNFFGKFISFKDHYNLAIQFGLDNVTMMVLDENVPFDQAGYTNLYTDYIQLSEHNKIMRALITGESPKIRNRGKLLSIMPNTRIQFYVNALGNQALSLTLGKKTILQSENLEFFTFQAGQIVNFSIDGFVRL
jgi:hypothetical protein